MKSIFCRTAVLLFLGVLLQVPLFGQGEGTVLVAERDTTASFWGMDGVSDSSLAINAGDLITADTIVFFGTPHRNSHELHLLIGLSGTYYSAFAKDFRPLNTEDVFGDDIFIDYPMDHTIDRPSISGAIAVGDTDAMWVPVYFQDILIGQNRNRLLEIVPDLSRLTEQEFVWYENTLSHIQYGRAMFYNSAINLGNDTHIAVRNIRKTDFGYSVDGVISPRDFWFTLAAIFPESGFWEQYRPGNSVTLLLYLDGEYLDIYTDTGIHVGTFIKAGREFIIQYQSLIQTGTCDLTDVQWPKRANGSTDYPPLEGVNLDFRAGDKERGELALPIRLRDRQSRSQTTDRLRVRENPDTSSAIVTTLDTGTGVQVLETGATETIGGITAPWVKVLAENGFTGWAFSGYLETQNQESTNKEPENVDSENLELENVETRNLDSINANPTNLERENVETQNPEAADQDLANGNPPNPEPENKKSGFPVLPFAVTGGVILVSGIAAIVVFAVLAKRRKGKAAKP